MPVDAIRERGRLARIRSPGFRREKERRPPSPLRGTGPWPARGRDARALRVQHLRAWPRLWRRAGGLVGLVIAAAGPAWAGAASYSTTYYASWAGLPAAWIRLTVHDGATRYDDAIVIQTIGLPGFFTRFRTSAMAEGRRDNTTSVTPSAYEAVFDLRQQHNSCISMRYVHSGGTTLIERGPGDTSDKPPLPSRFRINALDPLSAFERIRQAIAAARAAGGSFTVPVYDGTRRFNVIGHILPRDRMRSGTLRLTLSLQPIAGFKNRPGQYDPENAPRTVDLVVTDDARAMPLWLSVPVWHLPLTVRLQGR
jgi:hypothetical protein